MGILLAISHCQESFTNKWNNGANRFIKINNIPEKMVILLLFL
jgi:hypothetical protein